MFNENWMALAAFAIGIGLLFQQQGLVSVAVLLVVTGGLGWLWSARSLRGVEYRRSFSEKRAFLGETVDMHLVAANHKPLPISYLRIDDECSTGVTVLNGEVQVSTKPEVALLSTVMSLRWFEKAEWHYQLRCERRGFFPFGPARLQSGDLFGLFRSCDERPLVEWLVVYPAIKPIRGLELPSKEPLGDVRADRRLFEDPNRTIGVRPYNWQDPLKRIHWTATARRQTLQVRAYEPTTSHHLVIFLNMVTLPKYWQGTMPALLEQVISIAASVAAAASEMRLSVGLLANGCWPQSDQALKVLPSRSPDQLMHILEALAAISVLSTISIEDLLLRESGRLPWGATVVVVSASLSDELLAALVRLQAVGRRLVAIRLDNSPLPEGASKVRVLRATDDGGAFSLLAEGGDLE